jgi:hypothetical protein
MSGTLLPACLGHKHEQETSLSCVSGDLELVVTAA